MNYRLNKVAAACVPLLLGVTTAGFAATELNPTTIPKYVTDLVIPGVMKGSDNPGVDYQIAVRPFKQQMLPSTGCDAATQPAGTCKNNGSFRPTKVWGYGPASDTPPNVAPVPAAKSQFNHPSFTVEVERDQVVTVDWINDLVNNQGKFLRYNSLNLPVDQTLHWANPTGDCLDGITRTDCRGASDKQYQGPVPMVTHVHGAHTTPESDGYTEAWYLPNAENSECIDPNDPQAVATAGTVVSGKLQVFCTGTLANGFGGLPNTSVGMSTFTYTNDQPSTTLWYHDHSLGLTRLNVYGMGAGFWLIRAPGGGEDGLAGQSVLPGPAPAMGEDPNFDPLVRDTIREIPLVLQDKSFNTDGSLFYPKNRAFFEGLSDGQTYDRNASFGLDIPFLPDPASDISPIWNPEVFFATNVVNGVVWPKLDVAQQRYRFRMLNGASGRFYNLAMHVVNADGTLGQEVPFYQIGAEQSLLQRVVKVWTGCKERLLGNGIESPVGACPVGSEADDPSEALLMGPAERADVIVDFSGLPDGTVVRMINTGPDTPFGGFPDTPANPATTGQVMQFVVNAALGLPQDDTSTPADFLRLRLPDLEEYRTVHTTAVGTRDLALLEEESALICVFTDAVTGAITWDTSTVPPTCGGVDPNDPTVTSVPFGPKAAVLGVDGRRGGTVQLWDDPIAQDPTVGTSERWQLWNWSADAHPIHIHLVKFRVLGRRVIGTGDPDLIMPGDPLSANEPAEFTERGWKDTVIAYPGEVTTVAARFDLPGLYVWHCHLLEHEDNEMMVPYCVKDATGTGPGCDLLLP